MTLFTIILLALLLDFWLGEPRQYHPLTGFGRLANWLEKRLNRAAPRTRRQLGVLALLLAVLPVVLLVALLVWGAEMAVVFEVLILYLAIGSSSLTQQGRSVMAALVAGDLAQAREQASWMLGRDTRELDEQGVARATVESVLKHGNDVLFGAIFWFILLGAPGVVLYRLVNILDAMWGYRSERYQDFGWAAARLNDLLNWPTARLSALAYSLSGDFRRGWRCLREQGGRTDSPNTGVLLAAGAGGLGLQLGGPASYHSESQAKPYLGEGLAPTAHDIHRAIILVQRALFWWLGMILLVALLLWVF